MERTREASADRATRTERSDVEFYLPGMYRTSTDPGRVEQFLANLFHRRGVLPADLLVGSEASTDRRRSDD